MNKIYTVIVMFLIAMIGASAQMDEANHLIKTKLTADAKGVYIVTKETKFFGGIETMFNANAKYKIYKPSLQDMALFMSYRNYQVISNGNNVIYVDFGQKKVYEQIKIVRESEIDFNDLYDESAKGQRRKFKGIGDDCHEVEKKDEEGTKYTETVCNGVKTVPV